METSCFSMLSLSSFISSLECATLFGEENLCTSNFKLLWHPPASFWNLAWKAMKWLSKYLNVSTKQECKNILYGRLTLSKGDSPIKLNDLLMKLLKIWRPVNYWTVVSLTKGFYEFNFSSLDDQWRIWTYGSWNLILECCDCLLSPLISTPTWFNYLVCNVK